MPCQEWHRYRCHQLATPFRPVAHSTRPSRGYRLRDPVAASHGDGGAPGQNDT
jgi:hypothetical protein